jgi:hypothetical protein
MAMLIIRDSLTFKLGAYSSSSIDYRKGDHFMPLTEKELQSRDSKRDLSTELLVAVRQMKTGRPAKVHQFEIQNALGGLVSRLN